MAVVIGNQLVSYTRQMDLVRIGHQLITWSSLGPKGNVFLAYV